MEFHKTYDSGLKLIIKKMEGLFSVSTGILVGVGSRNETPEENGISHFIEHVNFKGTKTRNAFEISDHIDRIGSSINAYTSKEATVYYTKSTYEHQEETFEILADIFLNSTYKQEELDKEKGVIIEEINMTEDTPDEVCLDILSTAFYGDTGLGRTILGPAENIKRFTRDDVLSYLQRHYTPDNVIISVAGAVDVKKTVELCDKYFGSFTGFGGSNKSGYEGFTQSYTNSLSKKKDIEQAHIALSFPGYRYGDSRANALSIASSILGGSMSSRLFQKVREDLGLCYTVYSYLSQYKDTGKVEIYAGVNPENRDKALNAIIDVIKEMVANGITETEFARGKEQMKSAFIMSQESTSSQMQIYGKQYLILNEVFDFKKKIADINAITLKDVNDAICEVFDITKVALATVGKNDTPLKI
jgi:predicted Zn-dependent peptidase